MQVADRYRLTEQIGRGGMGEVWLGTDDVLGRQVAVKLLASGPDATATERFQMEARTAAQLNHPHVVAVYDFGAVGGHLFLVMELVHGPSLAQELTTQGPLAVPRVAEIGAQTAAGLAAAHARGVVHRDIKPGNLLQAADGTVKIADFGIAQFADDPSAALTTAGQIIGTSAYLAPERALGRTAEPASDVYALGCVLYELLAGRTPFRADTATGLLYQHVNEQPVPAARLRPDVPPAFDVLLQRMLAKQPAERPTAQQAAEQLAALPAYEAQALWPGLTTDVAATTTPALPVTQVAPAFIPPGRGETSAGPQERRGLARRSRRVLLAGVSGLVLAGAIAAAAAAGGDGEGASTPPNPSPAATSLSTAAPTVSSTAESPGHSNGKGHKKKHGND